LCGGAVVGAKLLGQASESTVVFKTKSARKEPVFPVMAITVFPNRFKSGTRTLFLDCSF
jgi:hypothetical protein